MCVGPDRINESIATLLFDYKIYPRIDKTYIISPYTKQEFTSLFDEFAINSSSIEVLPENYFDSYYDLTRWSHDNWYKQQAFKLCALDHFDSEYFLIQDCDLILLDPYSIWVSGELNFKAEPIWNEHQRVYADMVEALIGLRRVKRCSLVNELMPYRKQDWLDLKQLIEQKNQAEWLDAIPNLRPLDDSKWFSEYELLGIYKMNRQGWTYFLNPSQPPINSWDDFYNIDWSRQHSVKFHTPPLKHMNKQQVKTMTRYLQNA